MTTRQLAALFLIAQAVFFGFFCDSLPVPILAAVGAMACLVGVRFRIPSFVMYPLLILVGVGLIRATVLYFETPDGALAIFPVQVTRPLGELGLLWQAVLLLRVLRPLDERSNDEGRWGSDRLPGGFLFVSLATILFGFDQGTELRWGWYASYSLLFLTLGVLLFERSSIRMTPGSRSGRRRAGLAVMAVACVSTLFGVSFWIWASREIRTKMPSLAVQSAAARGVPLYVGSGQIGRIAQEQLGRPNDVALKVWSDVQPGYLRGRAYDSYTRAQWKNMRGGQTQATSYGTDVYPRMRGTPPGIRRSNRSQSVFVLEPPSGRQMRRLEMRNDPRRGVMYFTPLGVNYILGFGESVSVDANEIVHAGPDLIEPYVTYDAGQIREELSPKRRALLTTVSSEISPRVRSLANSVASSRRRARDKMNAIRDYLLNNYDYELSLGTESRPQGVEPISRFLLTKHGAHCEFFASAAVIMLRMQGVPARYVTGYVVTETEEEYGDYWVGRNKNAHAWAEAYDTDEQRWVVVEATPGIADTLAAEDDSSDADAEEDEADGIWQVSTTTSWNEFVRTLFTQLAGPTITLGVVFGAGWAGWRRYKDSLIWSADPLDRELYRRRRELRRVEKRLRRRGLTRERHETWRHFAHRVGEADVDDAELQAAERAIHEYAKFRYRAYGVPRP